MTGAPPRMYALCMKGNIYTNQKCPACGGKMVHNERKHNCYCECGTPASRLYRVHFGRDIKKRFNNYPEAAQFLSGLRFKESEGSLDKRDYQADQPLSFHNQTQRWLALKEKQVCRSTYTHLRNYINKAYLAWGDKNVKNISAGDIEDFLYADTTATNEKTRAETRSCINQFFTWLEDREDIKKPRIPKIKFELGYRTITDLDTQQAIITEVARIAPAKVAFAVELLATYPKLRPDDLRRITEADYRNGIITIHNPTKSKNKFKILRLLPEHMQQWEELKRQHLALPTMPFFRHHKAKGVKDGTPHAPGLLLKWWHKACKNLGVEGLDLYGGTRHTTTTAIARMAGQDNAKKASAHETNIAFERYCQAEDETAFAMAKMIKNRDTQGGTQGGKQVVHIKTATQEGK